MSRAVDAPEPTTTGAAEGIESGAPMLDDRPCRPLCARACPPARDAPRVEEATLATVPPGDQVTYPRFRFDDKGVDSAVAKLLEAEIRSELAHHPHAQCKPGASDCGLELSCRPVFVSASIVSVGCLGEWSTGAAHPHKEVTTLNVVIDHGTARPLALSDVFATDAAARTQLRRMVEEALDARLRALGVESVADAHAAVDGALQRLTLNCDGIQVVDVDVPFVVGPVDAEIPWSELDPIFPLEGIARGVRGDRPR